MIVLSLLAVTQMLAELKLCPEVIDVIAARWFDRVLKGSWLSVLASDKI